MKQHCQDFNALARELGVDVDSCNLDVWTSEVREHAKRIYGKSINYYWVLLYILVLTCLFDFLIFFFSWRIESDILVAKIVDSWALSCKFSELDKKSASEASAADQKSFELQQKIEYMASSINQRLKNINRLAGPFIC